MHSLYIHIPFCHKKCLYCSFVVSIAQEKNMSAYIASLMKEAQRHKGTSIQSVYMGGGTPTFLENRLLVKLLNFISEEFNVTTDAEWTIEANPEDINKSTLSLLKKHGVNRISLGVQTFNDRYLKWLGRNHTAQKAKEAFSGIKEAGFKNINVDLMFGFSGQTMDELNEDLKELAELASQHVSLYALTVEENSRFFAQGKGPCDEAQSAAMYSRIKYFLESCGFHQYEVSNFAKKGFESRHNLHYWQGGDYIGLGIGAHSHHNGRRSWNLPRLGEYLKRIERRDDVEEGSEQLSAKARLMERVLFGLRMNKGISLNALGADIEEIFDDVQRQKFDQYIREGFLIKKDGQVRVSDKGRLVLDELSSQLM